MKHLQFVVAIIIVVLLVIALTEYRLHYHSSVSHHFAQKKRELTIFHAGSLSVPFSQIEKAFEAKYPEIDILREAAGSRSCARKITDLHKPADIMASADESVITTLLMPEFATFNIKFVRNEMVIMLGEHSKYNEEITAENWSDILLRKDASFGHSDPNKDPCGYRSQLVWQLEEKRSNKKGLYEQLRTKMNPAHIRPKETDLLAMLEAGEIDYLFIYRSVAEQHKGKYLLLPKEINLGSATLSDYYSSATVKITGKKPGTFVTKRGAPMIYGITILKDAPNRADAITFLSFLFSDEGQIILKKNGHPVITPPQVDGVDNLPKELKKFMIQKPRKRFALR